ncbi:hypothetical protein ACVWWG_009505 [Bradyrhizobium sp. LB7.2]
MLKSFAASVEVARGPSAALRKYFVEVTTENERLDLIIR